LALAACLPAALLTSPSSPPARDEWFRGLDLEPALGEASLVLAARVATTRTLQVVVGGKGERALRQFAFVPTRTLKGVVSRDTLSLTSDDLGVPSAAETTPIEPGQLRLLMLGRSVQGYAVFRSGTSLAQGIPPLEAPDDPLLDAVDVLLAVEANPDRVRRVELLRNALAARTGRAAVPLLAALGRRALLAAQTSGVLEAVAPHLAEPSPAVREQAARTLDALLQADYLTQSPLREGAASVLARSLQAADSNVAARVAALHALGAVGPTAGGNPAVTARLALAPAATFAEQGARLHALGELEIPGQGASVAAPLEQLPLDAPPPLESSAEWAVARLASAAGVSAVVRRARRRYAAGLSLVTELDVLGALPSRDAAPALLEIATFPLERAERRAFAAASVKLADARLVAPLARLLVPSEPDVWQPAVAALLKIDSDAAAQALAPHLPEEPDLGRKLEVAAFLGRHGVRAGYPYAIEHLAEPELLERAVVALAAICDPRAVGELRRILETSNDVAWNRAAIRGLGKLGVGEVAPRFLAIARTPQSPLAPAALIALGDLREPQALALVRAGFASRNPEMLAASARAAGTAHCPVPAAPPYGISSPRCSRTPPPPRTRGRLRSGPCRRSRTSVSTVQWHRLCATEALRAATSSRGSSTCCATAT